MVLYHAIASQYLYFSQWEHQTIHFSFLFLLIFMSYARKTSNKAVKFLLYACMLVTLVCCAYVYLNTEELEMSQGFPTQAAVIVGICLMLGTALCTWLSWGLPLLIVAVVFVAYFFLGHMLSGPLHHPVFSFDYVVSMLSVGLSGLYGLFMSISADQVFLFVVFGSLLGIFKVEGLLMEAGKILGRRLRGGAGLTAVFSNSLIGMVSGAPVANVAITGPFVLPYMNRSGYNVDEAGGILACSATGSQLMPPVMGAAAFMMATFIGQPYAVVMLAAILPAVLYFTGIFIAVHLEAKKLGLKGLSRDEMPAWKDLGRKSYLLLPLILLVWLVSSGAKTMQFSAAVSILAAVVVGFLNKGERLTPKKIFEALEAGARGAITVGVACAVAGMIAGCITVTGLASILINGIVGLAGNAQIIGLALTMVCCIILGMGVPTTANYCIMASTCAPILIKMGIPVVAAHFFVFYFGIVADITPPVALAAYAGSAIAKSDPMKTGVNATKLAIAAFIVPYIFAYSPALLFENVSGWWEVTQICISALLGIFGIAAALNGHLYKKVPWYFRLLLVAGGLGMMIPGTLTDVVGLALVALVIVVQYWSAKREKAITA